MVYSARALPATQKPQLRSGQKIFTAEIAENAEGRGRSHRWTPIRRKGEGPAPFIISYRCPSVLSVASPSSLCVLCDLRGENSASRQTVAKNCPKPKNLAKKTRNLAISLKTRVGRRTIRLFMDIARPAARLICQTGVDLRQRRKSPAAKKHLRRMPKR